MPDSRPRSPTVRVYLAVICPPCYDCKYTDCVVVCPTECFYQDEMMLYVDPDGCIECEACLPECPVGAIYPEPMVPEQWKQFVRLNAERSALLKRADEGHVTRRTSPRAAPSAAGRE
jgi:ferredoxin